MADQIKARDGGSRYRVVLRATGNVGTRALRRVIEHPELDLAGVYVHGANKAGHDAGALAGLAPNGVAATNSIEDVIALRPDCMLYMPHVVDPDQVCRLLESGANLVSTRMELQNPRALDPALADRLEAACAKGGTSVHASGSSPGSITEAMPIVMASIQRKMNHLAIDEFADNTSLALFADAIGLPVNRYETYGNVGMFTPDDFSIPPAAFWPAVTMPALIVSGAESWTGDPVASGYAAIFPDARIVSIAEAGHWPHHDQLDSFTAALDAFLAPTPDQERS